MNNMASFTSNLDCEPMKQMRINRSNEMISKIAILETVGPVYSFNVDRLSDFANNITKCEFEDFVSGEFEVVDVKLEGKVYHIKIKQLHK